MNNRYVNRAKISEKKFREIVRYFAIDLNASQIAELTRLNRNTVNRYLTEIRKKIDTYCISTSPFKRYNILSDKQDENRLCTVLIRVYPGGITADLYYRNGEKNLKKEDCISEYGNSGYDLFIDFESGRHFYLSAQDDSKSYRSRLNRIKSFWSYARSRLAKFKGLHSSTLRYHVRECEFRFNNRDQDIYQLLLKILRNDPLF